MAWIESHQGIERHPKTMKLSISMGWDIDQTIGKLHRLWWWCIDFAPDGNVSRHSADMVALAVGLSIDQGEKFISSLLESGFLDRISVKKQKNVYLIHDWLEYAGRYLRDTKYKRNPEKVHEIIRLHSSVVSRQSADNQPKVSRKSAVPTNQPNQPTSDAFEKFWMAYPRKVSKATALKAWIKINPENGIIEKINLALDAHKKSEQWKKDGGQFIPHPATWLNQRRWEDELQPAKQGDPGLSAPKMRDPGR